MICASVGSGNYNKTLVGRDTRKNTRRNSMFRAKALRWAIVYSIVKHLCSSRTCISWFRGGGGGV